MMRLVVIGGGPAGVEAAKAAAPHAAVTIVSAAPVGAWRPLTSRVWLSAVVAGARDVAVIAERAAQAAAGWAARCAGELAALDVEVVAGRGRLGSPGEVLVAGLDGSPEQSLRADAVIVATGAPDVYPAGLAPDGERILTDADLGAMAVAPASALVLGDGHAGFELCHILSLLGAAVTWLVPEDAPHTRVAPEVDGYLIRLLERQGVRVVPRTLPRRLVADGDSVTGIMVDGARHVAEVAVLACGRRPDPQAVGLTSEQVATDIYGQTKRQGVYLVGDAHTPRVASFAMAHARAGALHAVGRSSAPADTRDMVLTFMAGPQVAKLGRLTTEGAHGSVTVALAESVAAHIDGTAEGFLTLAWDQGGYVAGALAVARGAADVLTPVALAMRARMRLQDLAAGYGPHPAVSELAAMAARKAAL